MTCIPDSRGQRIAIDPLDKARGIDGFWQQRVIAEMNDYQFIPNSRVWTRYTDVDAAMDTV